MVLFGGGGGTDYLGKNDVIWGQAYRPAVIPNQRVNKAEELTYLSTNIGSYYMQISIPYFIEYSAHFFH